MMFAQHADKIRSEAIEAYPNEAVWLIDGEGCRQVKNIASEPTKTFRVDKRTMASAWSRGLLAVVHSHPDFPDCPSESDMRGQINSGIPWGIVATDGENSTPIRWWGGDEKEPLIGRGFVHGITDCWGLIRDYYESEMGITLNDYPRDWEWWKKGGDLYTRFIGDAGFYRIEQEEARPGDIWLAQLRSSVPSHGGIVIDRGLTLHHPSAKKPVEKSSVSRREPIGRWLPHITHWMRHKDA